MNRTNLKETLLRMGQRLAGARVRKSMSIDSLSAEIGFDPGYISDVEGGELVPSLSYCDKASRCLLGVGIAQSFWLADEPVELSNPRASELFEEIRLNIIGIVAQLDLLEAPKPADELHLKLYPDGGTRISCRQAVGIFCGIASKLHPHYAPPELSSMASHLGDHLRMRYRTREDENVLSFPDEDALQLFVSDFVRSKLDSWRSWTDLPTLALRTSSSIYAESRIDE